MEVSSGSAAATAGLEVGDVITKVDTTAIASPDELGTIIAEHAPGDTVKVTFERGGTATTVTATLGTRAAQG